MKKTKFLISMLSVILILAVALVGTLAYLTDREKVVNTFTVGDVNIKLDEAVVDQNGVAVGTDRTEEGNKYHLIPGQSYVKDPTLTVLEGSEESYVRVLVTINCYKELTNILGTPFLPQYFVSGWDNGIWVSTEVIDTDAAANTATYEFRYYTAVNAKESDITLEPLFTEITVPTNLSGDQLETIKDLEISVIGHAIQKAGFADADDAWVAFDEQIQ